MNHSGPIRFALGTVLAGCVALSGCGTPPELRPKPGSPVPRPSVQPSPSTGLGVPGDLGPPATTAQGSPAPSFAEEVAVNCAGQPRAEQVIALVRRAGGLLDRGVTPTVTAGPLCAGSWQYTELSVPDQEPLLVVSRGAPGDLTLVTAGTNVCSIPVRTGAPVGIRDAALCPAPGS